MLGYNAGKCRWYEDKCLHTGNKNGRDDHEEEIMKPYAEMTKEELIALRKELKAQYREMQGKMCIRDRAKRGFWSGMRRCFPTHSGHFQTATLRCGSGSRSANGTEVPRIRWWPFR